MGILHVYQDKLRTIEGINLGLPVPFCELCRVNVSAIPDACRDLQDLEHEYGDYTFRADPRASHGQHELTPSASYSTDCWLSVQQDLSISKKVHHISHKIHTSKKVCHIRKETRIPLPTKKPCSPDNSSPTHNNFLHLPNHTNCVLVIGIGLVAEYNFSGDRNPNTRRR